MFYWKDVNVEKKNFFYISTFNFLYCKLKIKEK